MKKELEKLYFISASSLVDFLAEQGDDAIVFVGDYCLLVSVESEETTFVPLFWDNIPVLFDRDFVRHPEDGCSCEDEDDDDPADWWKNK